MTVFASVGNLLACAWIGPTASDTELLAVNHDGSPEELAFATNAVQMLATASTNYRPVTAFHGDTDALITSVRVESV
ncbi:MAG: hypothetical protein KY462_16605 [Actinobacteria bacterium]|nr:hypothetical protein [Actinomycetota bacterium]